MNRQQQVMREMAAVHVPIFLVERCPRFMRMLKDQYRGEYDDDELADYISMIKAFAGL
jgi:hypothetical protein